MLISRISSKTQPSFQGVFKIVKQEAAGDVFEKEEMFYTHAVYHPFKNESNAEIKKAMDEFRKQSKVTEEKREDGGTDKKTGKSIKQIWHITEQYTCELGEKLNSIGRGIIIN